MRLYFLLILLLYLSIPARADLFAPVTVDDNEYAYAWLDDQSSYGLQGGSIWQDEICYAADRAILLADPDARGKRAWLIRFGTDMLSLGAADWANAKRQIEPGDSPALRCFSLNRAESMVQAASAWHARSDGQNFIAEMRSCALSALERDACPITHPKPSMCEGWKTLFDRYSSSAFNQQEDALYWKQRWEAWVEEHQPGLLDHIRNSLDIPLVLLHIQLHGDGVCIAGSLPL